MKDHSETNWQFTGFVVEDQNKVGRRFAGFVVEDQSEVGRQFAGFVVEWVNRMKTGVYLGFLLQSYSLASIIANLIKLYFSTPRDITFLKENWQLKLP